MIKKIFLSLCLFMVTIVVASQNEQVRIKLYHTADTHGSFFPVSLTDRDKTVSSFAQASSYLKSAREKYGDNLLLMDGGDLLQGQPSTYYYNFVDTVSTHLCAGIMNYLKYDVAVMGNHDIEPGKEVYNRWISQCDFPVLGGNVLKEDGTPNFPPFHIFEKQGVKIAVVGLITQAVPNWLPKHLWAGLSFVNLEKAAAQVVSYLKEVEQPDIIVGLFHSGVKSFDSVGIKENVGLDVARYIPGFDVIFCGHDHTCFNETITNIAGKPVLVIDPGAGINYISNVTLDVWKKDGKVVQKEVAGQLDRLFDEKPDAEYMSSFSDAYATLVDFVDQEVGEFTAPVYARDALFGPSPFMDMLHGVQLDLSGADISLAAPLVYDAEISAGKVYVRDLFNLYKYENMLYVMELSGREVRDALEYSYSLWCNRMTSEEDPFLILINNKKGHHSFVNPYFSYDSAAGICYTVDLTQPIGSRVAITSMVDGSPFDEAKIYKVALSSYQGSGGGGILTTGSGIPMDELDERIVCTSNKDLRYYLAERIKQRKVVSPQTLNNWRFVQEEWVKKAMEREMKLLFGE